MSVAPGDQQAGPARGEVRDRRRELGAFLRSRRARLRPAEVAEQQPGGPVVGQDVEPGRDGVRGGRFEAPHERVQPGTGRRRGTSLPLSAAGLVFGIAGQSEQVLALVGIQPERIRDRGATRVAGAGGRTPARPY